jgi:predicted NAD-dependent protein-ADP-ribosyltransferase YbiA (DUF1768 family)
MNNKSIVIEDDSLILSDRLPDSFPGSIKGEFVKDPFLYLELASNKNWRTKLSNYHIAPFVYENLNFLSIKHAVGYCKYKLINEEIAYLFSLDSKSKLSNTDSTEIYFNGLNFTREIEILWNKLNDKVYYDVYFHKISQYPELQELLLLTNDSKLFTKGKSSIRLRGVEQIRRRLRRDLNKKLNKDNDEKKEIKDNSKPYIKKNRNNIENDENKFQSL